MLLALVSGCDLTKMTADMTTGVFQRAAPAFEQYWDYDLAGDAAPAQIIQLEGVLRIVPDNKKLLPQLIRAYDGYAMGWVETAADKAEIRGDYEESAKQNLRAKLFYERARDLAMHQIRLDHEGIDDALKMGVDDFSAWLKKNFKKKGDAEVLLWAGYSWGSYIKMSKDDMTAVADLAYVKALVQRSIDLDPDYYHSAGTLFLAVATTQEMSADMDQAKKLFEEALAKTQRRNLLVQLNMARYYAVKRDDKALFEKLLHEVLDAGDVLPDARLGNQIAKAKAAVYLEMESRLF
ncbi:MAG: hypothetical protein KC543_12615 [Myxococcales bacterium]|nr:hypothetical protein [Myxococcales bacterium]